GGEEVAAAEARLQTLRNRLAALGVDTDDRVDQVERLVNEVTRREQALRDQEAELATVRARVDLAEAQARTYASAVERLQEDARATHQSPPRLADLRGGAQRVEAREEHRA